MNSAPKIIPSNEFSQNIEPDASKRHLKDATKDDLALVSNVDSHNALIRYIVVPHGLFTGHREYRSIVGGLLTSLHQTYLLQLITCVSIFIHHAYHPRWLFVKRILPIFTVLCLMGCIFSQRPLACTPPFRMQIGLVVLMIRDP
jgi:hypothetical protein